MQSTTSLLAIVMAVSVYAGSTSAQNFALASGPAAKAADGPQWTPSTGLTVEVFAKADSLQGQPVFVEKSALPVGSPPPSWRLGSTAGNLLHASIGTPTGVYNIPTSFVIDLGGWHHYALTYDGAVARVFADGVQRNVVAIPGGFLPSVGPVLVGGESNGGTFPGQIDEVRIWSVARSPLEIAHGWRYPRSYHPSLIAGWHLDNDGVDVMGANHLTTALTGTPLVFVPSSSPLIRTVSAPTTVPIGGTLVFALRSANPFAPYVFDASLTGTSPGLLLPAPLADLLPLNRPFANFDFQVDPSLLSDFFGFFDATGSALAAIAIPDRGDLVGLHIDASAVELDPNYPGILSHAGNGVGAVITGYNPTATSFFPAAIPATGNVQITVFGTGYVPGSVVILGSLAAATTFVDSQTLKFTAPAAPPGATTLSVLNPDGASSSSLPITYVPNLNITSITPVAALPGTTITIAGIGFQPGLSVASAFGPLTVIASTTSSIQAIAPAVPCTTPLSVQNPGPSGAIGLRNFNVPPTLGSANPLSGPAAGGTTVTLIGANFAPGMTVTIGGNAATILSQTAATRVCVMPPHPPGPAAIVLTQVTGCSTTATQVFTYL